MNEFPQISTVEIGNYGDPVAWRDSCSPLILIDPTGPIAQAGRGVGERRELIRRAQAGEGTLLLAWTGQYSTTVFVVDDYERALDGLASPGGRVR
jgi:hypothetical protein